MRVIIIFTEIYILGMSFQTCQPQRTVLSTWVFSSYLPIQCTFSCRVAFSWIHHVFVVWIFSVSGSDALRHSYAMTHHFLRMHLQMSGPVAHFGFVKAYVLQSIYVLRAPLFVHAMTSVHPRFRRCRHHPQGCQYSRTAWQSCRYRHPPPNHCGWCCRPSSVSYGSWEKKMNLFICKL